MIRLENFLSELFEINRLAKLYRAPTEKRLSWSNSPKATVLKCLNEKSASVQNRFSGHFTSKQTNDPFTKILNERLGNIHFGLGYNNEKVRRHCYCRPAEIKIEIKIGDTKQSLRSELQIVRTGWIRIIGKFTRPLCNEGKTILESKTRSKHTAEVRKRESSVRRLCWCSWQCQRAALYLVGTCCVLGGTWSQRSGRARKQSETAKK